MFFLLSLTKNCDRLQRGDRDLRFSARRYANAAALPQSGRLRERYRTPQTAEAGDDYSQPRHHKTALQPSAPAVGLEVDLTVQE